MKSLLRSIVIITPLFLLSTVLAGCACSDCETEDADWGDWEELDELEEGERGKKGEGARPSKAGKPQASGAGGGGCANFAGSYAITTTVDKRKCDEGVETKKVTLDFEQSGCAVSVPISITGARLRGTARGDRVTLTGKYNQAGTINKNLTLKLKGDTISGGGTWTYSTADYKCSGTEKLSGRR